MTPIGHFACEAAVAGNIDLTTNKETSLCFGYYLFFLITFYVLTLFLLPGRWAMHLHDWFGNAALIFFVIVWSRSDERKQAFVCLLIGGQVLSAYTHVFDILALKLMGEIPTGMWRPHNILHTPLAALAVPAILLPLIRLLVKGLSWKKAYFFLVLGYALHILADTGTYDYAIYPLWPFSSYAFSLVSVFQHPDVTSSFLGSPLYIFERATTENIDGFIVYRSEVAINLLLAALFYVRVYSRRLLAQHG